MELEDEETNELVVRPDGKAPRVKSNIKAKLANKGHSLTKHKVINDSVLKKPHSAMFKCGGLRYTSTLSKFS